MFTPRVARLSRVGMVGDCGGWGCGSSADFVFFFFFQTAAAVAVVVVC